MDLNDTIGKPKMESRDENYQKGKEVTNEEELGRVKSDLEKSLKWTWSSDGGNSGCSKNMNGSTNDFLSLKALQGGNVFFENGKKRYILGVGRIGKSLPHSIRNVYYVNGLKYNLLSVSQIYGKGNKVEFVSKSYTVTNLVTVEVVQVAKRYKNIYVADFESLK
ncbi:uncharacterized protein [Nicotiana sylvestris]|uniref:uncharacterized protein n=1 Tax=Nicotiana sylvestris TaxID=4096 RepID=UPI00388CEBDC